MVRYRSVVADSARWEGFAFRDGDIVISTSPKCGTTWIQMVCALLIFQKPDFGRPLGVISPWLDMVIQPLDVVLADLEAQEHRRFIKTHTPLDGLPWDERVTYICVARDPRDVALSWGNHMANLDLDAVLQARSATVGDADLAELLPDGPPVIADAEIERFWQWVDDTTPPTQGSPNLRAAIHHLANFWPARERANVVLLHYDDLLENLQAQMRYLAGRIGIDVPEDRWPALVQAASFDEMRRRADELPPGVTEKIWRDNQRFFSRGTSGQWRNVLGPDDQRRYQERVQELAEPELSAWLHHGPIDIEVVSEGGTPSRGASE
jgi:aryl sulfotransferase